MSRFVSSWSKPFRQKSHRISHYLRNSLRPIEANQLHNHGNDFSYVIRSFASTSSLAPEIECATSADNNDMPTSSSFPVDTRGNLQFTLEQRELLESVLRPMYNFEKAQKIVKEQYGVSKGFWLQIIAKFRKVVISRPHLIFDNDAAKMETLVELAKKARDTLETTKTFGTEEGMGEAEVGNTCNATTASDDASIPDVPDTPTMQTDNSLASPEADPSKATFKSLPPCDMENFSRHCIPFITALAQEHFPAQMAFATSLRDSADLRSPHTWYPLARSMKRKIIYHAGPTNSGKTYNAIQALKNAWSGVYCGPLRLLALEVYESLNQEGVYTSLLTGQEKKIIPFGEHVSCTIEMVDTEKKVDVAVIDEIQMIGDETRGASWTRALLGVPAKEVHVCGDPAAIPAVSAVCDITGDEFEVKNYERLTAINPLNESLGGDYSKIEEGDAIVAFSRKDIYAIRKAVEQQTKHKCCVVYGSLPPETRSAQARLFNDPNSGYRVLVASDAIGMGLNLNIRRVVFHTMRKFDGQTTGPVTLPMVKQIAGRAGRRNSIYPEGFSTTLHDEDLPYLHECVDTPTEPITRAGLFPDPEQLRSFSAVLPPGTPLAKIISEFLTACQLEGPYFMCRSEDMQSTAELLQPYPLTLEQRSNLCLAPANLRNLEIRRYFLNFVDQYVSGQPVRLNVQLPIDDPIYLSREMESLEAKASALDIYLWMYSKLGSGSFPDVQEAIEKRAIASAMLESSLMQLSENTKGVFEAKLRRQRRKLRQQGMNSKSANNDNSSDSLSNRNAQSTRLGSSMARKWKLGPVQIKRSKAESMSD